MNEKTVQVNGREYRIWEKGTGDPIGYIPGYGGAPKWHAFLDALAEKRKVVVPSMPGFPGGERGHLDLDSHLDWVIAVGDILEAAGLRGGDLVGVGWGAPLAADAAAVWDGLVRKLVLISPFGIFDENDPTTNLWAQRPNTAQEVLCADPQNFLDLVQQPNDADPVEWQIVMVRANEAAARYLWPFGDTRLQKRLPRITQDVLLVWGDEDKVVPKSYAKKFQDGISGKTKVATIKGAGHLAELDQPDAVAKAVLDFCG